MNSRVPSIKPWTLRAYARGWKMRTSALGLPSRLEALHAIPTAHIHSADSLCASSRVRAADQGAFRPRARAPGQERNPLAPGQHNSIPTPHNLAAVQRLRGRNFGPRRLADRYDRRPALAETATAPRGRRPGHERTETSAHREFPSGAHRSRRPRAAPQLCQPGVQRMVRRRAPRSSRSPAP